MLKHIEVIVGKDNILLNEIHSHLKDDNLGNLNIFNLHNYIDLIDFIKDKQKITTLIILEDIKGLEQAVYSSQNIINFTDKTYSSGELRFHKPFKLCNFLHQLSLLRKQYISKPICLINMHILFDTKLNSLKYEKQIFKLTDKETEIIQLLLSSPEYKIDKALLLNKIWGFSSAIDTNTLETHISKLKQKLPQELVSMKDNNYLIKVYDLH